jgi:CRP/FNR family transcriptional regulator
MPFDAAPNAAPRVNLDCMLCPVRSCLGRQGGESGASAWAGMLASRVAVMPGAAPLISAGSRQQALYSVRAGCIKTFSVDAGGHERVRGFHLPGDLLGLDALGSGIWQSSAAAIEPSQVCVAPAAELRGLLLRQPDLGQHLMQQASRELALALAVAGDCSSEQRMAAFLLQMEQRLHARDGLLRLPMPQRDIGNYLRLATETVCRVLKRFEKAGWLRQESRGLRVLARHQFQVLAEPVGLCAAPLALAA